MHKTESESVSHSVFQLCDLVDCSLPGSFIHGISQAGILEWVSISFSRDLPDPGVEPMSPEDSSPSEPQLEVLYAVLKASFRLPRWLSGKESACQSGDMGLIPGMGRSPGEGSGNLLQYSCLENPVERGAWWAIAHEVIESWTQLSN